MSWAFGNRCWCWFYRENALLENWEYSKNRPLNNSLDLFCTGRWTCGLWRSRIWIKHKPISDFGLSVCFLLNRNDCEAKCVEYLSFSLVDYEFSTIYVNQKLATRNVQFSIALHCFLRPLRAQLPPPATCDGKSFGHKNGRKRNKLLENLICFEKNRMKISVWFVNA